MPKTTSAKKALRQNRGRRIQNIKRQKELAAAIKEYKKALSARDKEAAAEKLGLTYQALDKAVKTKVLKPRKAARLKSLFAKKSGTGI